MKRYFLVKQPYIRAKIVGIMLISIGIVFLFNRALLNIKIGFTSILIGIILLFLRSEPIISMAKRVMKKGKTTCPKCKYHFEVEVSDGTEKYEVICPICENKFTIHVSSRNSKSKSKLLMPEKITLVMTAWILVMFFMTGEANLEVFFALILIGMLLVREFADDFITVHLKHRIDGFIYVFLIIFVVIIGEILISF